MRPLSIRLLRVRIPLSFVAFIALSAGFAGCGGGGGGGGSSNGLKGTWEVIEGELFAADGVEQLTHLDFGSDSRGRIHALEASTNVRACGAFLYSASSSGVVTIDSPGLNYGDPGARILLWDRDGDLLTVSDQLGASATLQKVDEIPAEAQCLDATVREIPVPYDPQGYNKNFAFDGELLWYVTPDDRLIGFDPVVATTAQVIEPAPGYPIASQNGDLWTMCNCGGDETVRRYELPSTQIDQVYLPDLVDFSFYPSSGGVNAGSLWISVYNYDDGTYHLLQIDAASEPPVLVSETIGPLADRPFTFANDSRWVLSRLLGDSLSRIGPGGLAEETLMLPTLPHSVLAIAGEDDGNVIYMLGYRGVIYEVTLP